MTFVPQFHIISTGKLEFERIQEVARRIHPLVDAIHIREKAADARMLLDCIRELAAAGMPLSKLIVNDRADVARVAGVKGVHLGGRSLDVNSVKQAFPGLRIGRSSHSLKEAVDSERQGADYVIFGHVYPTGSKPGLPARGLQELKTVASSLSVPVIAIGGIRPEHVPDVLNAGAAGIAVLSGVMEADRPEQAAEDYVRQLRKWGRA
ncbi:thiazole tautomerase TenI [Ferviditalea candida]|uniref:Thiamine-phosphate synthase n=1 Tax=Ferviditalea candida TaxID=3108399 RepID=A0ABU5ZHJ6_9BACL|nr:thiazole tautomerase TenI [Paenibacillaceae bacterium T2]